MSAAIATLQRATPIRPGLALIALFAATAWLLASLGPAVDSAPRWPADGDIYAVDGWTASPAAVDDSRPGLAMVTHTFTAADRATRATVVVSTSPTAKLVYRAGAAVPFLGNGYTVEPLPAADHREAFIARRGDEAWLQLSIHGERRGQFGNGPFAWALTTWDGLIGHSNDYYLARIVIPYTDANVRQATALADTLFPRLASFYAQ